MSRDLDMVACAKDIIGRLPPAKSKKSLHFVDLDHAQRVMAIDRLCQQRFMFSGVFAYKPTIPDDLYMSKNQFYHYTTRYLIERISWMCRDFRPMVPEGDGRVKLIFSRRGGMSYAEFQNYLTVLRDSNLPEIQIHWPVIDIDGVEALDHSTRYGLQLADLAISGMRSSIELDRYGNVEPRYAEMLKPRVYQRHGNFLGYGAKLYPNLEAISKFEKSGVAAANTAEWSRIFGN